MLYALISTLIAVFLFQYISESINSNRHYTTAGRIELLKEGIIFSFIFTLISGFVLLPLYKVIAPKRK
jgi:hypothetical protein